MFELTSTLAAVCGLATSLLSFASGTGSEFQLIAADGALGDRFGSSVSVDGDVLAVGRTRGSGVGSVSVYRWSGSDWGLEQELVSNNASAGDEFGYAVAVRDGVLVVGSPSNAVAGANARGSATVFRWNGSLWLEEQELLLDGGEAGDRFGYAVSLDGDALVVGAIDGGAATEGAAVVFRWNGSTWDEEAVLEPSSAATLRHFGRSVSMSGSVLVAGASLGPLGGGVVDDRAFAFRWDGSVWQQEQELESSSGGGPFGSGDGFGWSVAVSGDVLVVGAPTEPQTTGRATVFRWNGATWSEEATLASTNGLVGDWFGSAVAVDLDTIVVGAMNKNVGNQLVPLYAGAATVFGWNGATWTQQVEHVDTDPAEQDVFGWSVAIDDDVVVAGVRDDVIGANAAQGSAFAYGEPAPVSAEASDVDEGESVTLEPGGDGGDETEDAYVTLTNTSGGDDATVTVTESDAPAPAGGGFGVLGVTLTVETTLLDGQYSMTLTVPFEAADLSGSSPLLVDLAFYDTTSGEWELAALGNTLNSPGHGTPVGDRFEVQGLSVPAPVVPSTELGDYGVFWNTATQQGYAWANVDHTTDFKVGFQGLQSLGCGTNPASSLAAVAGSPMIGASLTLAVDDPLGTSSAGSPAFLLASITPDPDVPCGTLIPGTGMSGPSGELLIGLLPPNPVAVLGPVLWTGPGAPAQLALPIPNNGGLAGLDVYLQGVIASPETFRFTDALQVALRR